MSTHARPVADRFIQEAKKLRVRNASDDEIKGAARVLYPNTTARDLSMRARLMRACRASNANFLAVLAVYERGANIGAIVAELEPMGITGAPIGNLNARGKKKDFSLKRINNTWRAMTRAEQERFLAENRLARQGE
jgi:hypothetical protein